MSDLSPAQDLLRVRDRLLAKLSASQKRRQAYEGCEWVAAERQVMLEATNAERRARHLPPVTQAEIAHVERWAYGHSDYSSKFALYCAELAIGEVPGKPMGLLCLAKETSCK